MEKLMLKGESLFEKIRSRKHKKKATRSKLNLHFKELQKHLSTLQKRLSHVQDTDQRESFKCFAEFYDLILPEVRSIVTKIVQNKYPGIDDRIDKEIFKIEYILGHIRTLKDKYHGHSKNCDPDLTIQLIKYKLDELWILKK